MLPPFLGRGLATCGDPAAGTRRAWRRELADLAIQTAETAPRTWDSLPPSPGQVYASRTGPEIDEDDSSKMMLRFDAAQARALKSLDRLHKHLHDYGAARSSYEAKLEARLRRIQNTCSKRNVAVHTRASPHQAHQAAAREPIHDEGIAEALHFAGKFARSPGDLQRSGATRVPRGLYIHGGVGTGKSLCMDLLYETSSIPKERKRRLHFHDFMAEAHRRVHEWKMQQPALSSKEALAHQQNNRHRRSGKIVIAPESDALVNVAQEIANEAWLLCFDEFQVTDVADALIMSKLFGAMWACGTVVVATSNRALNCMRTV